MVMFVAEMVIMATVVMVVGCGGLFEWLQRWLL